MGALIDIPDEWDSVKRVFVEGEVTASLPEPPTEEEIRMYMVQRLLDPKVVYYEEESERTSAIELIHSDPPILARQAAIFYVQAVPGPMYSYHCWHRSCGGGRVTGEEMRISCENCGSLTVDFVPHPIYGIKRGGR